MGWKYYDDYGARAWGTRKQICTTIKIKLDDQKRFLLRKRDIAALLDSKQNE